MNGILLSIKDVERETDLGHTKVCELIASGEIESIKVGRRRLIPKVSLEKFVERQLEKHLVTRPHRSSEPLT